EKTFIPPDGTQQNAPKSNPKKAAAPKNEIPQHASPLDANIYQKQIGLPKKSSFKQGQNIPPSPYRPPSVTRNIDDSYLATSSPESFVKPSYHRSQVVPRPQSNTSCDSSYYQGSISQPSPSGSMDSSYTTRTPLSNNPPTPQPSTPQ
uniref:Uncharacterized protein n=1 Tax=Ciona savignyi TaxID=51511 RepID=H2Z2A0_CIOSA